VFVSLDTQLRTDIHRQSGDAWNTPWGRVGTTSVWRFLAYRVTATGIAVSGTYSVTWKNETSFPLATAYHPLFYDGRDFKIAEYFYTGPTGIKFPSQLSVAIPAGDERTVSEPFQIDVASVAVANTIEFMVPGAHGWESSAGPPPTGDPLTVGGTATAVRPSNEPGVTTIQIEVTNTSTSRATSVSLNLMGRTGTETAISSTSVDIGTLEPGETQLVPASFTGTYRSAWDGPRLYYVDYTLSFSEGANITGRLIAEGGGF
jgi:hypothetical protein